MMPMKSLSLNSHAFSSFSTSEIGTNQRWAPLKSLNFLCSSSKPQNLSRFVCVSSQNGGLRENTGEVGRRDAVIIVDHGSRRKESNVMLNEFVKIFKHKIGYEIVEPTHMELAEPSIRDAFQSCVKQGAHRVIVDPFFSVWKALESDIPSLSAEAAKEHPGVAYIVTARLGLHELLVDQALLKALAGDEDECSVCAGTGKCELYYFEKFQDEMQNCSENEVFLRVCGKKHPGYVRGMGLGVSPSQIIGSSSHATSTTTSFESNKRIEQMQAEMNSIKAQVVEVDVLKQRIAFLMPRANRDQIWNRLSISVRLREVIYQKERERIHLRLFRYFLKLSQSRLCDGYCDDYGNCRDVDFATITAMVRITVAMSTLRRLW
ncbi:hypothetical protein Fmac_001511 [Flemingia macrophylla]|uniref:Sirohydrochlorin ferrochelatase n=1 Tax=Flemingia macrophylla TaxID=520843 RepID=A0ABD1NHF7_9FABA